MTTQTFQINTLSSIPHYQIHSNLLPFVGSDYDKYRIFLIGESHFINQDKDKNDITLLDFEKWWEEPCLHLLENSAGWVDTRNVINNYMSGKTGSYSIFTNIVKSFSRTVLDKDIKCISLEDKQLFSYFAFMNFFQMPSLYSGVKYWDALKKSAKLLGDKSLAIDVWDMCVEVSTGVVDTVIDILKPKVVVFTSISAGNAYKETTQANHSSTEIVYTSHPATPFTWNKSLSSLKGKTGKAVFEEALLRIYK